MKESFESNPTSVQNSLDNLNEIFDRILMRYAVSDIAKFDDIPVFTDYLVKNDSKHEKILIKNLENNSRTMLVRPQLDAIEGDSFMISELDMQNGILFSIYFSSLDNTLEKIAINDHDYIESMMQKVEIYEDKIRVCVLDNKEHCIIFTGEQGSKEYEELYIHLLQRLEPDILKEDIDFTADYIIND